MSRQALCAALAGVLLSGCANAHVYAVREPAARERLERLAAAVQPQTGHPEWHYWVRAIKMDRGCADVMVFRDHHIFLSDRLVDEGDDLLLAVLLAHAMAHHDLDHPDKGGWMRWFQLVGFGVAGAFLPGAGLIPVVTDPLVQRGMVSVQERGADDLTVEYLEHMGYTAADYVATLEFLQARHWTEQVGGIDPVKQKNFSRRIERIRRRLPAGPAV